MKYKDLDFLHKELLRVSDWIKFSDQKAGFTSVYYSAAISFLYTQKEWIITNVKNSFAGNAICLQITPVLSVAFLFVLAYGIWHLFFAISPRLKNHNTSQSMFYFGTVSSKKVVDYIQSANDFDDETARRQILEQIHTNSSIANQKLMHVKKSVSALMILFVLVFIIFFFK